jgi:hypothetical protein
MEHESTDFDRWKKWSDETFNRLVRLLQVDRYRGLASAPRRVLGGALCNTLWDKML